MSECMAVRPASRPYAARSRRDPDVQRRSSSGVARPVRMFVSFAWRPIVPSRTDVDERLPVVGGCLLQVALDRPEPLDVPLEPRLGRIRGRGAAELDGIAQVLPLLALDLGLRIRVADVHVGVGQQMERARPDGLQRERLGHGRAAADGDRDGQRPVGVRTGGNQQARVAGLRLGRGRARRRPRCARPPGRARC